MAKQTINIGTAPNSRNGEPLRTAFNKINQNFTELYAATGGDTGQFTFATNTVTVAGTDMNLRTTRTGFDVDADVDIQAADDVFIEAAGDEVGISAANEVTITTSISNMHPTNWTGQEEDFVGTWNGTTLTLTVPNGATTLITLLDYYTGFGNIGDVWLKTASGYVQTENNDPANKTIGTGETVFEIPVLASSPVANADVIRMKLYDSISGDPDKQWTFTKNGKLEFPNGGMIEPVGMGWIGLTNGITGTPVSLVNKHTDGDERSFLTLNGGVDSGSIGLLTVDTTGESNVYHNWEFTGDGSLLLPAGGTIAEGIVTSNPTIQLTPANPDVASQKLVIKGGGNYNADENGIALNWYIIDPLVGDTVEIYINSPDNANQTLYWWIHPAGAGVATPESGTVTLTDNSGNFSFTVDSDDYEFTVRVSPENNNYDPANIGVETQLFNSAAPTFGSEHHLHLTTGDLTETSIFLGTDDHNVRTTVNGGIEINTFLYPSGGGSGKWTFDADGVLTLPGVGTYTIGESEPGMVFTSSVGFGFVSNVDGVSSPALIFGSDGNLTLPGAVVNSTVSKTGTNPDGNRVYFEVTEVDGSGTVTEITVINSPNPAWITPTSGISYVDIDYSVNFDGSGNATVTVNSSGTGHSLGEAWDIAAEAVGATTPTPTAIDLTKSINKLANGHYTLADGTEGQIMYLVRQSDEINDGIRVYVTNQSRIGTNEYTNNYFDSIQGVATLIYTDGAWQASNVSWD